MIFTKNSKIVMTKDNIDLHNKKRVGKYYSTGEYRIAEEIPKYLSEEIIFRKADILVWCHTK